MSLSHPDNWRVAYACLALRVGETLTVALGSTPLLRLLEATVCRNYYRRSNPGVIGPDDNVPEDRCKIAEVQSELSHINGLGNVLYTVPAVIAGLYYLARNQSANKNWTLLINVFGALALNLFHVSVLYFYNVFDPRWIWLRGIFSFIGGGDLVFYGLIPTVIAESIDRSKLSSFYIYSSALSLTFRVMGSAGSLFIMRSSVWLPVLLSFITKTIGVPVILIFLRSISDDDERHLKAGESPLLPTNEVELSEDAEANTSNLPPKTATVWDTMSEQRKTLLKYLYPLAMFSLHEIGNSIHVILAYWLSRRYHWSLRETGWVLLGVTLLNALIVSMLPRLSEYLQRQHVNYNSKTRDLNLARMCLGFASLGAVLLGFSWHRVSAIVSLGVQAGGIAFRDSYLSYITADMEKAEIAQVYVVLEMVSLGAYSVGGWLIADIYALCLDLGDSWTTSLPIWACVLPFLACWYCLK